MFPVTIKGITFPCHFKSQSKAMAAAYSYFESIGKDNYEFTILRARTDNGKVYFVLKAKDGSALPVSVPYDILEA